MEKDNAIYDRYGERLRIFISDGKNEKEIDRNTLELLHLPLKRNKFLLGKMVFNYFLNNNLIKLLDKNVNKGFELRKTYLESKYRIEPKYSIIKLGNKTAKFLISGIFGIKEDVFIKDQYNAKYNIKNKIVFDIGANVGVFSIYAALNGAKKIYAFEPVPETYKILKKNIENNKLNKKIIPINLALGDKKEIKNIYYNYGGDQGATIIEYLNKNAKNKLVKIKIATIDEFVKKNKIPRVDFIKMDIEGYEENAILGSKETIRKWKPILSFSAYHLPTDKERLPKIVKSIRPDYKIKLNKYGEENFYCG